MRRISALALVLLLAFSTAVYAGHWKKSTPVDTQQDEWGVGTDVIIHEGKDGEILNKVTGEYKFDMNNNEHKGYLVATTKLADIWNKITGLFNRGE